MTSHQWEPPVATELQNKSLTRKDLEDLIFRSPSLRRFTQDSPILQDVWIAYGLDPDARQDLLMVPNRTPRDGVGPGELYVGLRDYVGADAELAYHQSSVAARLTFTELARVVLPLAYWQRDFWAAAVGWQRLSTLDARARQAIAAALTGLERGRMDLVGDESRQGDSGRGDPTAPLVLWTLRLVGTIEMARRGQAGRLKNDAGQLVLPIPPEIALEMVDAVGELVAGGPRPRPMIFSVTRNRSADVSVFRSVPTVKADAARRLFEIDGEGLIWAIVDSGVDAEHPAFRERGPGPSPGTTRLADEAIDAQGVTHARVTATYDFTPVRALLNVATLKARAFGAGTVVAQNLADRPDLAQELEETLDAGESVTWSHFAELLRVPHVQGRYRPPVNEHGTHVAAILGGDWRTTDGVVSGYPAPEEDLIGMCPGIQLLDVRVLDDNGTGDEFSVMAALQFVRGLNTQRDVLTIHGVNLSMALKHDVANYACGRTPVCEEAERLVATGATVVAAAGNEGYMRQTQATDDHSEGYRSISITDPGNADSVITVGATHGYRP